MLPYIVQGSDLSVNQMNATFYLEDYKKLTLHKCNITFNASQKAIHSIHV